jgi:hypothetical protein
MPIGAGVASQTLATEMIKSPRDAFTLSEVPPKRSVDSDRHRFLQTLKVVKVRATQPARPVLSGLRHPGFDS